VANGDDPAGTVVHLRATTTKDGYLMGSGNLAQSFIELDLIEKSQPNSGLKLAEVRPFDTGAVLLRYIRNREV
jgi:hypothetical protein